MQPQFGVMWQFMAHFGEFTKNLVTLLSVETVAGARECLYFVTGMNHTSPSLLSTFISQVAFRIFF